MAIGIKFKAMKDASDDDACNRYDYISSFRHDNIFLQSEQTMYNIVTDNAERSFITSSRSYIKANKNIITHVN